MVERAVAITGQRIAAVGSTADEAAVRAEAQAQAEAIACCVAADPVHQDMALLAAIAAGLL